MADELATITGGAQSKDDDVSLTIPRRHFGDFVQGLLGEPRRIEREYDFPYVIDLNALSNFDSIVMQRVTQQHEARLIDFQAKVYFSNQTRKTLPSREAFLSFGDNSPNETIGVTLVWIFLIQFPHSKIPERQAIRFRAFSWYSRQIQADRAFLDANRSTLKVEIEHTEITWGDDIFSHIDRQIDLLRPKRAASERIFWGIAKLMNMGYTVTLYFIAVFLILFLDWKRHYLVSAREIKEKIAELSALPDPITSLARKLDFFWGR